MAVWRGEGGLRERLEADLEVRHVLSADDLAGCFDPDRSLRHVDAIYERVFGRV
jgi:adenylosuccinate lyase